MTIHKLSGFLAWLPRVCSPAWRPHTRPPARLQDPQSLVNALKGGRHLNALVHFRCVIHGFFVCLVANFIVCLVANFSVCLVANFTVCLVANFIVCQIANFIVCRVQSPIFCLSSPQFYCMSSKWLEVQRSRYARPRGPFGPACGPFGPTLGGDMPPAKGFALRRAGADIPIPRAAVICR